MLSADDRPNFSNSFKNKTNQKKNKQTNKNEIQIFITIFRFSMKNALKWVQTSLVLVQLFLR